jgi:hypothetical protein
MTKKARSELLEGMDALSVALDPDQRELYRLAQQERALRSDKQRYRRPVSGYRKAMRA